jgi:hypothetical protein
MMQTGHAETLKEKLERLYPKRAVTQPFMVWHNGGKGMRMTESLARKTVKAGSRVYFFDLKPTSAGTRYLAITELRKGMRRSIMVFPEDAAEFLNGITEMLEKLS